MIYLPEQPEGDDAREIPDDLAALSDVDVAVLLMLLISETSEWDDCACWMADIEHDIWQALEGDRVAYGYQGERLPIFARLKERLGGQWVAYLDGRGEGLPGVYLLAAEEWAAVREQPRRWAKP